MTAHPPKLDSSSITQVTNPTKSILKPSKRGSSFRSGNVLHINGNTNFTPLALLDNVGAQLSSDLLGKLSKEEEAQHDCPAQLRPTPRHTAHHAQSDTCARNPTEVEHHSIAPKGKLLTIDTIPQRQSIVSLTDPASVFLLDLHNRSQQFHSNPQGSAVHSSPQGSAGQPPGFGSSSQPPGFGRPPGHGGSSRIPKAPRVPDPFSQSGGENRSKLHLKRVQAEIREASKSLSHLAPSPFSKKWRIIPPAHTKLMNNIVAAIVAPARVPSAPPFNFNLTEAAAKENFKVLSDNDMDLDKIIRSSAFSPISYGSEFKDSSLLEPIFANHPNWLKMKDILDNGSSFPLEDISEQDRLGDIKGAILKGNHKSASDDREPILTRKMEAEVKRGWTIPLMRSHISKLPKAMLAPLGLTNQATINDKGEIVYKDRVTHDLSHIGERSGTSINSRIIDADLPTLQYGHMHSRQINYIVACRRHFPNKRILLRKDDFKSAYRRQHLNAKTAMQCIMQVVKENIVYLLIAIRLTFGGKVCPHEWCALAEPICDLANEIIENEQWDPYVLQSPAFEMIPPTEILDDDIPFAQAKEQIIDVPLHRYGKCDEFLDDVVTTGVDHCEETRIRLMGAAPLAIYTVSRDIDVKEPITRDDMITEDKMLAEGALAKLKIILGWLYNTRRLLVSLPGHKHIAWSRQIQQVIDARIVAYKELDTIVGRLTHAACIIPMAGHFLSRIRAGLRTNNKWCRRIELSDEAIKDLVLWLKLLDKAHQGISMNLLCFRSPNKRYRTDACERGMGGFSHRGRAWRYELPLYLRGRAHIGLLEFIAQIVSLKIDIFEGNISLEDCILMMGDSSNGMGWVRKSNFQEIGENIEDQIAKLAAARHLAEISVEHSLVVYSQWFPGKDNIIPDSLSRDWHLSDAQLLKLLTQLFPSQLPQDFNLSPLPTEVESWISSILLPLPRNEQRLKAHKPSGLVLGDSGKNFCPPSALKAMTSWKHLMIGTGKSYASASPKQSETQNSLSDAQKSSLLQQSSIPSVMWHRPSGLLTGQTQH